MKRFAMVLFAICLGYASVLSQTTGDYRSAVNGGSWGTAGTWEKFDGANWVAATAAPGATNNVTIRNGYNVILDASGKNCKNLIIETGATFTSGQPTGTVRYVRINGDSAIINGTFGDPVNGDGISLENARADQGTVVITGSGTFAPNRVRVNSNVSNTTTVFDIDTKFMYTGSSGTGGVAIYPQTDNNTFIFNAGKTITFVDYGNMCVGSSISSASGQSVTFIVNGTIDLSQPNSSLTLLSSAGDTAKLVVGSTGSIIIGDRLLTTTISQGTSIILNDGSIEVKGSADFSNPLNSIQGAGNFKLDDNATFLCGHPEGLNGSLKNTGTIDLSTKANYTFKADSLPQVTGALLPEEVGKLTIIDSLSLNLSQSVVVDSGLIFNKGKVLTGDYFLTLGPTATVTGAGAGKFVEGNVLATLSALSSVATWPIGIDSTYLPAQLYYSNVIQEGKLGVAIRQKNATPLPLSINPEVFVANTYGSVLLIDPIDIHPDSLMVTFNFSELPPTFTADSLQVICVDEENPLWNKLTINRIDSANGIMVVSGRISPSQFVLVGPSGVLAFDIPNYDDYTGTNFGNVAIGTSSERIFSITNTGNIPAQIDSITNNSSEFVLTLPTMPAVINPAETLHVPITFTPASLGRYEATIKVYSTNTISLVDSGTISGIGDFGSISKIRDARALPNGTVVTVQGVATRVKGAYTFIQDTTGGINVYGRSGAFADSVTSGYVQMGAVIKVMGKLSEYNGLKEINITDLKGWQKEGMTELPIPIATSLAEIASIGEQYESMLITVPNITISTTDQTFIAKKNYDISDPTDQSHAVVLRIGDARDTDVAGTSVPTTLFTFTGVLGQYSSTTGGYQLLPILTTDIQIQVDVEKEDATVPQTFVAYPAYPNPFNPTTTIKVGLPTRSELKIKVYSILGQEIATLYNGIQKEGYHTLAWDASKLASGIYFVKISAQQLDGNRQQFNNIMKVVLMK